jgi:hypothetical protein
MIPYISKQTIFSDMWHNVFDDPHQIFYKNIYDLIVQNRTNRLNDFFQLISKPQSFIQKK